MQFKGSQLNYFVTVADEGQITRAAARLHVAQPALSQAISQLEEELGFALLVRHARGVTLTPAGEAFLPKARAAVRAAAEAGLTAEWLARAAEGTIEFGFVGIAPGLDSPELLASFKRAQPDIDVRFRELPFPTSPTRLWLSRVDVAVCHAPPPDPAIWSHLLREEPRVVLAPSGHRLARREVIRVADALEQTFVGLSPDVERRWAGFWSLDDHRGGPPARLTPDQASSPQEVIAALTARDAITTCPTSVAALLANELLGIHVIRLLDAEPCAITLVGHADHRNPLVAEMLAFLLELGERSAHPLRAASSAGPPA